MCMSQSELYEKTSCSKDSTTSEFLSAAALRIEAQVNISNGYDGYNGSIHFNIYLLYLFKQV